MSEADTPSLEELVEQEKSLSRRRSRLHDQIDFLRGSGRDEPDAEARLASLLAQERTVSGERRRIQALIDARRA
jgi:hypothetical protein